MRRFDAGRPPDLPSGLAPGLQPVGPASEEEVELGSIVGVFGVRGEVRLHLHNRDSDLLDEPRRVILTDSSGRRFAATLDARSGAGGRVLGRVHGWAAREHAQAAIGWKVAIRAADLPSLDADEFYVRDLLGLPVRLDGAIVGRVTEVHPTDGGDVLEIDVGGSQEFVLLHADWVEAIGPDGVTLTGLPWEGEE
ncbi:MAG TPA: ribosome maturation factor RimM [Myxococcota bacterium]|nr:ribosome maturation factor RimM [Myxococcota bacterium]